MISASGFRAVIVIPGMNRSPRDENSRFCFAHIFEMSKRGYGQNVFTSRIRSCPIEIHYFTPKKGVDEVYSQSFA